VAETNKRKIKTVWHRLNAYWLCHVKCSAVDLQNVNYEKQK